jgi:hypothetical protein
MATTNHVVTPDDVKAAREAYQQREPRDVFYRTATVLVDLALRKEISITLAESLAVLLQTWNKNFYRFHKDFNTAHFEEINEVLHTYEADLAEFRERCIEDLRPEDEERVLTMFAAFEAILGPVGAAKSLHLLAPRLFPIWDTKIAQHYRLGLSTTGSKKRKYWRFTLIAQAQCLALRRAGWGGDNSLKAIDEYNYCKYTLKTL